MTIKKCTNCGKTSAQVKFHKSKSAKDGLRSECHLCRNEKLRIWYQKSGKQKRIRKVYGIDEQDLTDYCLICKSTKNLHIDHCHSTGEVRGRLCQKCNHGIGLFNDNPRLLRKAAKYLQGLIADSEADIPEINLNTGE